jgi:regulator of sigma E protease
MDKEQLKLPPEPHEFRSKKAWQRLIIMVGGVVVNVLLAILIFIGITWHWGEEFIAPKDVKYGWTADKLGKQIGLQDGDNIVAVNGIALENAQVAPAEIMIKEAKTIQVIRNGKQVDLNIPEGFISSLNKNRLDSFGTLRVPFIIDSITKDTKILKGSIQKGDRLIATRGIATEYFHEYFMAKGDLKDVPMNITLLRNNKDTIQATVQLNENGRMGIANSTPDKLFAITKKTYNFSQSISVGTKRCFETLDKYMTGLKQIFTGKVKASESLGSVISIGNTFPGVWDWERFWTLTGIFSIILAFMNILPIPALDGGHALFTLVEMITGKKPSDKFMEYAQTVGMVLLLGLMAYALGLDFWRMFK